ncbi:MAG: sigma 54-interacting transcriptional regulator, partial [candidate division Zixibacteria bacterium]|nr:sigma 54-interacting transcriptional regulator [candidate division Zixibacteria bacterium]
IRDKEGLFKAADGGTFFLDEIGNTSLAIQVKLLRVLEDKTITPVGETKPVEVDVRLIAATNSDLEDDVKAGRFRADLFYRLNVIPLHIPPLRERKEDIKLLTGHFINLYCSKLNCTLKNVSETAVDLLKNYHWPGNVRELENMIEQSVLLVRSDTIEASDLPDKINTTPQMGVVQESQPSTPTLESIEKAYIHFVMSQTDGKKAKAAKILGIDTSTLYRKIERYGLKDTAGSKDTEGLKSIKVD